MHWQRKRACRNVPDPERVREERDTLGYGGGASGQSLSVNVKLSFPERILLDITGVDLRMHDDSVASMFF